MKRSRIFTFAWIASLLLCIDAGVAWERSFTRDVQVQFTRRGTHLAAAIRRGRFEIDDQPQRVLNRAAFDQQRVLVDGLISHVDEMCNRREELYGRSLTPKQAASLRAIDADIQVPLNQVASKGYVLMPVYWWSGRRPPPLFSKNLDGTPRFLQVPAAPKLTATSFLSAKFSVIVISFGLLPLLALLLRLRLQRRAHRQLCLDCGNDLRFSQARCPECGVSIEPLPPALLGRLACRAWRSPAAVRMRLAVVQLAKLVKLPRMDPLITIFYLGGVALVAHGGLNVLSACIGGIGQTPVASTLNKVIYTAVTLAMGFLILHVTHQFSQKPATSKQADAA